MEFLAGLLPLLTLAALGVLVMVVLGPVLVRSAAGDSRRIALASLYVTCWTTPVSILVDPSGESTWTTRATQGGMLVAALLGVLGILGAIQRRREDKEHNVVGMLLAVFMLITALSGLVNGTHQLRIFAIPALTFAVVGARFDILDLTTHLRYITRGVMIGSLGYAWYDYAAVDFTDNLRQVFGFDQLAGLTAHPNVLGPLAAFALAVELSPASRRRGIVGVVGVVAASAVCMLAQSRAGWLCAALVIMLTALAAVNRRPFTHAVVFLSTLGAVIWLAVRSATVPTGRPIAAVDPNSLLSGRFDVWQIALRPFRAHPLLGSGPEAFGVDFRSSNGTYGGVTGQAHNQVLEVMSEVGLVGLALFLFLAIIWWRTALRQVGTGIWLPLIALTIITADGMVEAPLRLVLLPDTFLVLATAVLLRADGPARTWSSAPEAERTALRT